MNEQYVQRKKASIDSEGRRKKIRLSDVNGRFTLFKRVFFILLIGVYAIIPFLKVNDAPLIFIDILHRRFFLFGHTFNAQDFYLAFFLLAGFIFCLFYVTAILGRVWCGYACPQTVFLEGVFRRIERWVEGTKSEQVLLAQSKWNFKKISKFIIKHLLFLVCASLVSHIFISYFVSLEELLPMMKKSPKDHWEAFMWMSVITLILYIDFAWFREQVCMIVCPYGRFQSALIDDDSLVIGYDTHRGNPPGKVKDPNRGDCIDCYRCVEVCPTGIDIRNGLQMECVGCANCIDACDDMMLKTKQKPGLIRYDSLNGLEGKQRKILRPRLYLYTLIFALGITAAYLFIDKRINFEGNILRSKINPYTLQDGTLRNQFELHLVNKSQKEKTYLITHDAIPGINVTIPLQKVTIDSLQDKKIPIFLELAETKFEESLRLGIQIKDLDTGESIQRQVLILGPKTNHPQ